VAEYLGVPMEELYYKVEHESPTLQSN